MKNKILVTLVFGQLLFFASSSWAGNSISNIPVSELPTVSTSNVSSLSNPSLTPDDIITLAPKITKSVVTIVCGNKQGTAWSINSELTTQQKSQGFKSYLVTNHHVIADCTQNTNVTLILSDKSRQQGIVFTWDETSDLAGVLTTAELPTLNWQGSLPMQGYWVGVIGSPLGFAGILTTGIISSVDMGTLVGTLTAPINPGNSGGPVFDRAGRVIGIATAKYINAEGFGIFNGTPLLCKAIINCPSGSNIWYGQTRATSIFSTNPYILNQNAVVFSKLNSPTNAGMMFCYTSPALTDEMIDSGNITGTFWRITDITTATVLDSYLMPIEKSTSDFTSTIKVSTGSKSSLKTPEKARFYSFALRDQTKGHEYECAVSIVSKGTVGEFTTTTSTAQVSGKDFVLLPEPEPSPAPSIIAKKSQAILNWNLSKEVSVSNQRVSVSISSNSGLPVLLTSNSQNICLVSAKELVLIKTGRCVVTATQPGNSEYEQAENLVLVVDLVSKKNITITCVKGKVTKKITAIKPICPTGYKKK